MSRVIEKPSWWSRFLHLFEGFDGPLAFAVFILACAGLIIMFSSGYDHGTRFVDPVSYTHLTLPTICSV